MSGSTRVFISRPALKPVAAAKFETLAEFGCPRYVPELTQVVYTCQALSGFSSSLELTQIKCYREGEVDEGSADTLTHNRGYPSPGYEFICQTRGPGPHPRPLSASRSAAQDTHPR